MPKAKRRRFLESLSPDEAAVLHYWWDAWARGEQLAPDGDWYCWLILAGRGWGKTRAGAEFVRRRVESGKFGRIALIGETAADVRDVMIEGESGLLAISPPWFYPTYEPSRRRLTWPNGAIATTYSGEEPDQLRGPQHDTAWADELAKWRYGQEAWDNLEMGLRLGPCPQVVVTTTPRPIPLIKMLKADEGTVMPTANMDTYQNIHNVSPVFIKRVIRRYEGTRLGRQELRAEILDDNPDALWRREEMIERHRVRLAPAFVRVAVAIDPSGSSTGNEAGIIAGGVGPDGHAYIVEDASLQGSPNQWGNAGVTLYLKHEADAIVGEVNFGGEMVETIVHSVAKDRGVRVTYRPVRASRGKYLRAEPVSRLYEQGLVHHVGMFPRLEDEQCQWTPGQASPNRLDALVWLLTFLMLRKGDDGEPEPQSYSFTSLG